ncbi:MAG TPA: hypothetical protein VMC10_07280 [Stellaceae bacterium]|nr:hypothetical protein [Stellaceae bacterium]
MPSDGTVTDATAEFALGRERLADGDPAGALAHFRQALLQGHETVSAGLGLALCLALCGHDDELRALIAAGGSAPEARLAFLQAVLLELVGRKAWDCLCRLPAVFAGDPHLRAVSVYYAGCAEIARRRHDAAWPHFEEFKGIVLPRHREFPLTSSKEFNLVFRQACLIEPPARVREIAASRVMSGLPPGAVTWVGDGHPGATGPVFLCCCDSRYFRRFAAELCRSLAAFRPGATVHFHIAAPEQGDLDFAQWLAARHGELALNLTLETAPLFRHPVYYTCNRFLVAPQLLQRYGRPLAILDADSVLLDDLGPILAASKDLDFACFDTGRIEPASVFQATILCFATSAGARRLLEILGRLVLEKLAMPPVLSWMLDQAALYSALRYAEIYEPEIAIGDLTRATGREMRSFIGAVGTMAEKGELMNRRAS